MKKEWFFDRYCGHLMVALLEDGELAEFAECGGGVSGRLCRAARESGTLEGMLSAASTWRISGVPKTWDSEA